MCVCVWYLLGVSVFSFLFNFFDNDYREVYISNMASQSSSSASGFVLKLYQMVSTSDPSIITVRSLIRRLLVDKCVLSMLPPKCLSRF